MSTEAETLRLQRIRWYRKRPLHRNGCDWAACGGCAPTPPDRSAITERSVWTDSTSRIVLVHLVWGNVVQFKTIAGGVVGKTRRKALAGMHWSAFLARFTPYVKTNDESR